MKMIITLVALFCAISMQGMNVKKRAADNPLQAKVERDDRKRIKTSRGDEKRNSSRKSASNRPRVRVTYRPKNEDNQRTAESKAQYAVNKTEELRYQLETQEQHLVKQKTWVDFLLEKIKNHDQRIAFLEEKMKEQELENSTLRAAISVLLGVGISNAKSQPVPQQDDQLTSLNPQFLQANP